MKTPHRPPLFQAIVDLDREIEEFFGKRADEWGFIPFFPALELIRRRRDYTRAAEKALQWNHNKGNTA